MSMENKSKGPSPTHPPYRQMIEEAICGLKESNGSTQNSISRFIQMKYGPQLKTNFKKILSTRLKKMTESGELTRIKNSFKFNRRPYNKSQRINLTTITHSAKKMSSNKTKKSAHRH